MARIYQRTGKTDTFWYLDYKLHGQRIRKCIGTSKEAAETTLADVRAKLEQKRVAEIVEKAGSTAVFLDQPVIMLPSQEYQSLLAQAGRKPHLRLPKKLFQG